MMMMTTATERFELTTLGRATVDGTEWVIYTDGAYRHVVAAEDYDAAVTIPESDDDYTDWCGDADFADDETAKRVAAECDCETVHSATDGVCGLIKVMS